jgi:hypothetical protein
LFEFTRTVTTFFPVQNASVTCSLIPGLLVLSKLCYGP